MSLTLADLINDVEGQLYSYGMQRDKVTTLTAAIGAGDTTLSVANAKMVDRGYLEIDQELMAVASLDVQNNLVTLHPWGRGQRGTVAVAHSENSKVTASPRFPRSAIAKKVQQTVRSIYPDLYRIATDETSIFAPGQVGYPVPAEADSILSLSYELPAVTGHWHRISRFRFNQSADTTDFPTGKSLSIFESVLPGRTLRIAYRAGFGTFADENTTLTSVGLQDRWADLICYGTVGSLMLAMESTRLESDAVETQERAAQTTVTQSTAVARQLLGMFKQRISEERSLLHRQHPPVLIRQF